MTNTIFTNHNSINDFFTLLNNSCLKYVVMRNYENMHEQEFFCGGHEDIDILVDNPDLFISITKSIPKMWPEDKIHLVTFINDNVIPIDLRCVGDNYYDYKWELNILENRVLADNGPWYVMNREDYYYSLAYHSILQKKSLSQDYLCRLNSFSEELGLQCKSEAGHIAELYKYMQLKGYKCTKPNDNSVKIRWDITNTTASKKFKHNHKHNTTKRFIILNTGFIKKILKKIRAYLFIGKYDVHSNKYIKISIMSSIIKKIYSKDFYEQILQQQVSNFVMDNYATINQYSNEFTPRSGDKVDDTLGKAVFTMWWQGEDDMPYTVASCIASLSRLNRTLIVITKHNYRDYIIIPSFILEKYDRGFLPIEELTNIVKYSVLLLYGGIWCDATTYIAVSPPRYMTEQLFLFQREFNQFRFSDWWIVAKKGNEAIRKTLLLLMLFWKKNNYSYDSRLSNIIWNKVIMLEKDCLYDLSRILFRSEGNTLALYNKMNDEFSDDEWTEIKKISPVLKIPYKKKGFSTNNTYYIRLCNRQLP